MGRFLVILGILGIIGGVAGMAYSILTPIGETLSAVTNLEEQAKALCNTNENLVVEQGASMRNTSGTYGRTTYFYCVNEAGDRREITSQVSGNVVDGAFGSISQTLANSLLWTGVIIVSILFIMVGGMMGARRRMKRMGVDGQGLMITVNGQPIHMNRANVKVVDMQNPTNLAQVGQMMNQMLDSMMPIQPSPAGDIASRLQQLDQLYHSNLISREEYETTRQKILDDLA